LGDAELTAAGGSNTHLDAAVANLVAGSGADQGSELSAFAIRYVLVRDGAPRQMGRVLDSTPGLSRLSQLDGSALWRVDQEVARVMIVPADGKDGADAVVGVPVGSRPVEAHSKIPQGDEGRVLRIADVADPNWQATLNGRELTRTTVDDWAQGFKLPAEGGTLDLTYNTPVTHSAWVWTQVAFGVVLLVLALPGRRRDVDDDLPEELVTVPAEPVDGEGRRARRLRAAAQAEAAAAGAGAEDSEEAAEYIPAQQDTDPYAAQDETGGYAAVPQQQYGEWDGQQQYADGYDTGQYADTQYAEGQYGGEQYQADPYQAGQYEQPGQYQQDGQYPQDGVYDPYGYAQQQPYPNGPGEQAPYDGQGGPYLPQPGNRNYDDGTAPGQGPWQTGNASRGESE
ncbi:MAG TPA: family 2 glycosyl transferase, partial [Streptomyces sp.]